MIFQFLGFETKNFLKFFIWNVACPKKSFYFGVAIQLSQCAPTGNGYRLISKDGKNKVSNDVDAMDNLVEIYTFNHAKCDGMDFQGIIILTKVQYIKSTNNICSICSNTFIWSGFIICTP